MQYHDLKVKQRLENAKELFEALNKIQLYYVFLVIVGGDFNCDILLKRVETNFEIPPYTATEHWINKARATDQWNACIDHFACNNYDDEVNIKISDVHADTICETKSRYNPLIAKMTITTTTQPHFPVSCLLIWMKAVH